MERAFFETCRAGVANGISLCGITKWLRCKVAFGEEWILNNNKTILQITVAFADNCMGLI